MSTMEPQFHAVIGVQHGDLCVVTGPGGVVAEWCVWTPDTVASRAPQS